MTFYSSTWNHFVCIRIGRESFLLFKDMKLFVLVSAGSGHLQLHRAGGEKSQGRSASGNGHGWDCSATPQPVHRLCVMIPPNRFMRSSSEYGFGVGPRHQKLLLHASSGRDRKVAFKTPSR